MEEPRPRARGLELQEILVKGRKLLLVRDPLELRPDPVVLPPLVAFLMQFMDGTRTCPDLCTRFALETGQQVQPSLVAKLVADLDEALLLESPRFEAALRTMLSNFRDAPERNSTLADRSYPGDPAALTHLLREILGETQEPRPVPPAGLLAPHIDLTRGLEGYRAAYRCLAGTGPEVLHVLLGTSHAGASRILVPTSKDFVTPLGRARTDRAFLDRLALGETPLSEEFLHRNEHSLEFQVLFLQALAPEADVRIVPLLTGPLPLGPEDTPRGNPEVETVVASLRAALAAEPGRTCLVAGADLAHIGPHFGDPAPLEQADRNRLEEADRKSLALVAAGDADGFFQDVAANGDPRRICGLTPIYLLLRCLEPCSGSLLHYGQALAPDGTQCVSFAALSLG